VASLVGRIGSPALTDFTNGFFVGPSFTATATSTGRLFLGMNGFVLIDRSGLPEGIVNNSGSFSTTITVSSGTPSDEKQVNHTPVPSAPTIVTTVGTPGTSQISVADEDVGQTHTFAITRQPSNGTATVSTSGLVTYTPKTSFTGSDSLIVTVTDSGSPPLSGAVTIAVTVSPTVSFAPARNFPVGDTPQCVAIGDLNNDGRLDLAVANFNFGPVFVLLGDGSGSFSKPTDFDVNGFPDSIAIGDLNGDGRLDIVVNRTAPTTPVTGALETVSVLLGDGSGSFGTARRFEAGPFDHGSVVIGDLNSDRKQDVVVPSSGSDIVSVLLGNGDGTLQTARNFATGVDPLTVAIGDVNGDGKMDVVTANQGSNNISVLLGNGDGTFQTARNFSVGEAPHGVAIGDLNGDGKLDIAVANGNSNNVSVLIGDGRGGFAPARNFGADNSPFSIAIGDLNSDGKFDLAVANFSAGTISVLLGKGDGTFQTAQNFLVGKFLNCITIVDLNGDGKPDVVVVNEDANSISVLLNNTP